MTRNVHALSSVTIAHHFSALAATNSSAPAIAANPVQCPPPQLFTDHDEKGCRVGSAHDLVDVARRFDASEGQLARFVAAARAASPSMQIATAASVTHGVIATPASGAVTRRALHPPHDAPAGNRRRADDCAYRRLVPTSHHIARRRLRPARTPAAATCD